MQQENRNCGETAQQTIRVEQGKQIAGKHHLAIDRNTLRQIGESGAEQKRGQE